jgi:glycosyltransferase involved in cell wall biosynthesis
MDVSGGHGGMTNYDVLTCEALAQAGLAVALATSDEIALAHELFDIWPVFHSIFRGSPVSRGLRYVAGLVTVVWRCWRRRRAYQEVILHNNWSIVPPADLIFVLCLRLLGITCVSTVHDVRPYISRWGGRAMTPFFYRMHHALVVHTHAAEQDLRELLATSAPTVSLVPLPSFGKPYLSGIGVTRDAARRAVNLPSAAPIVLFFGLVKHVKGLGVLIDALPLIRQVVPDALLVIVGEPWHDPVARYEDAIVTRGLNDAVIRRWGPVDEATLTFHFRAANVVALPYLRASQSAVCLTAYALERPVVATRAGGLPEQVVEGETGYLVTVDDPQELAQALSKMLRDPGRADEMGRMGRRWMNERHGLEAVAAGFTSAYGAGRVHGSRPGNGV